VRESCLQSINEVVAKGSRVNVIDSKAIARVELGSLISTGGRFWARADKAQPKVISSSVKNLVINVTRGVEKLNRGRIAQTWNPTLEVLSDELQNESSVRLPFMGTRKARSLEDIIE
jgi:hypothetical protein